MVSWCTAPLLDRLMRLAAPARGVRVGLLGPNVFCPLILARLYQKEVCGILVPFVCLVRDGTGHRAYRKRADDLVLGGE